MPSLPSNKLRESIPSVQLSIQNLSTSRGAPMTNSKFTNTSPPSFLEKRRVTRSLKFDSVVQRAIREARDLYPTRWNLLYLSLRFETIELNTAIFLNGIWHSRLPNLDKRVATWLCYGAKCSGQYCAAAVWSLPVARLLPQDGSCLELRRF